MRLDAHLTPRAANFRALTPLDFLNRALTGFAERQAIVWDERSWTWAEFGGMVEYLRLWLADRGIGSGDVVSVMVGNRPEMLAAHYAVPALGAVLNAVNTRLDTAAVAFILGHAEAKVILCDPATDSAARAAADEAGIPCASFGAELNILDSPPARPQLSPPSDEWAPIALNYTSGTTGDPKGVVLHHRGAYLNAVGNVMALGFGPATRYLWTLPMFHCNGWCHTWAVTAAGGVHVCLDRVDPALIFDTISAQRVSHLSGAPVVLYMLLAHDGAATFRPGGRITVASGGAAPTSRLISEMEALGFDFTHLYGLTECYGPTSLRVLAEDETGLAVAAKAALLSRQGVSHVTANRIRVVDSSGHDVPEDGETPGEIALSGNTLLAGYYRNAAATEAAFSEAGFLTGDVAVVHPGGDIEIRDRSKDVIISGGENISSLEVEEVLHRHPGVSIAAVVAGPHEKWGEVPVAFVEPAGPAAPSAEDLTAHCRAALPGFKVPKAFVFGELPKTATGKIRKVELRERAKGVPT